MFRDLGYGPHECTVISLECTLSPMCDHIASLGAVYRKESKFGTQYMVLVSDLRVRKLHFY